MPISFEPMTYISILSKLPRGLFYTARGSKVALKAVNDGSFNYCSALKQTTTSKDECAHQAAFSYRQAFHEQLPRRRAKFAFIMSETRRASSNKVWQDKIGRRSRYWH